jgi:hypothetical protein
MNNWQRILALFTLGIAFVLAPIIFPFGWLRQFPALSYMVGFWFIGEVTSQFSQPQIISLSNSTLRNLLQNMTLARMLLGLGALTMFLAMFLPWFQIAKPLYGVTSNAGYSTDGLYIGLGGIVPLVVAIFRKGTPGKPYSIFCTLWGSYILLFLINVYASLETSVFIFRDLGAKLALGPHVSVFGVILVIIGGSISVYTNGE